MINNSDFDEIKQYLPKYLSPTSTKDLFDGLRQFPHNLTKKNFYTSTLKNDEMIFQGDCIRNMLVMNFPNLETKYVPALIFSNTCDIDQKNKRNFPSQIVYSPIVGLNLYEQL